MTQSLYRICRVFLLFLVPFSLFSQTPCYFTARVTDAQSGEPLEGASLKLDGRETAMSTDSLGRLKMPVTCAEHTVRLQMLGYKPFNKKVTVAGQEVMEFVMDNIATQIEEVVISSQGSVRTMETPALGVSMLSMKAVQKLPPAAGEVDILRGIQTLPGISAVGEGANGVNIRGGAVDQNLVLLDNMPVFNPTHLLGLFSLFPTDAIREMQIYKGSIPARYGGRTAGVLDVKMSEPNAEKFRMRGGIGLISNRLHMEIPIVKEKLAWMTSGRFSFNEYLVRFYNGVLYGPIANKRLPNNKPVFFDFANKVVWRPTNRDNISLTSYVSYDSYRVDSLFSIANIVPRQSTMQYGHNNLALRWNRSISEQMNLNVLAVQSLYNTSTSAEDVKVGFDFDTRLRYHNVKAELTYAPSTRQRINMGASITRYGISPAELLPREGSSVATVVLPDERAFETAVFISDEYEIGDRLLIEPGLRYVQYWNLGALEVPVFSNEGPKTPSSVLNYLSLGKGEVESTYGRLEPRMALRYKLSENSSVKIGYNRMNQFLQIIANNTTPLPNARWKTSNRYVPPAQSDLFSAGYFRDTKSRIWEWSVEGYYRRQSSIYDYLNGAELSINPLVETQLLKGSARAYGAELFVSKKKGVMTGWLSYTYARSFQQITGDFPAIQQLNDGDWFRTNIDKPHTVNMLLNFQSDRHNAVSFTFTYSTGRPYTAPVSFYQNGFNILPVFSERNNARISDYHRLDFSWTISNPSMKERRWESSWVVTIYNLYGRKNAFSYFFNPALSSFQPFKVSVFPTPLFSLTYNFKFE
ncbi:MAG TPA: TonB-dependent receptor plug domain-containing protein [Saprospiraceae bacterium]|nr:TonB-dependent receptor plug domain-containing protein [Saprospiraceae bacterium]HPI06993.1 TonB-dependent receptor plug domain-containing protein [Saprospiraceae bacterium]